MQQRLNKTSTRVSAVNERSRHGHEKGAIKKQPQVCDSRSKAVGGTAERQIWVVGKNEFVCLKIKERKAAVKN